jgi:hypothetical protein
VKNIFSADEPIRQVEPEFSQQRQAGEQPQAPSCVPIVPVHPPVPLRIGESMANEAGSQTDWKNTRIG